MASNLFKLAFAVLILGWAPLLLYIAVGSADGNPVGLGFVAWASIPLALLIAATSGVVFLTQSWKEHRA
jgi:hypothetical protein